MDENEIKSRLDYISVSAIPSAIDELFGNAKVNNPNSYRDAIRGISKIKGYRFEEPIILQMTQHFAEFYNWLKTQKVENEKVRYMLQLINYGLFWENTAVQRLLCSLVEIAGSGKYSEPLFMQTEHNTNTVFEWLISDAKRASLDISSVIDGLYNNQIRNATVHAQLYFFDKGITLMNHKSKSTNTVPSISYDLWKELYLKTAIFIETLFIKRLNEYKRVK